MRTEMLATRIDSGLDEVKLLTARQVLYRCLSLVFADPSSGSWQMLANQDTRECVAAAAEILRAELPLAALCLARGERPLAELDPNPIFEQLPDSPDGLNAEYECTFGLLISSDCPPYGTEYINEKFTFQRSHALADIAGYYRAFGLQPSSEHPDRADHISTELEFLAFLIGREREARQSLAKGAAICAERAEICRQTQARFLQNHIAWWGAAFAQMLEIKNPHGIYAAAGRLLAALIPAERTILDVPAPDVLAAPSRIERPEECESCALHPNNV